MNVLSEIFIRGYIDSILGNLNILDMVLPLLVFAAIAYIKLWGGVWESKKLEILRMIQPLFMFLVILVLYLVYFIVKIFFDR